MEDAKGHGDRRVFSEATRAREAYKYIQSWESSSREANQHTSTRNGSIYSSHRNLSTSSSTSLSAAPIGCEDTSLAAFAQLGTFRLNARRCLISLLGVDSEYFIAESTPTLSLQADSVHGTLDALWLGTCSIPKIEGLTELALHQWQSSGGRRKAPAEDDTYYSDGQTQHWTIVSDVRRHPDLLVRPFIRHAPRLRFLASVPIRTSSGLVVGSYTIMDDKPRFGLSETEVTFLEDMADTVMGHLEMKRTVAKRERGDRLIKGLALFNDGKHSLRDWWMQNYSRNVRGEGYRRRAAFQNDNDIQNERADEELGMTYTANQVETKDFAMRGRRGVAKPTGEDNKDGHESLKQIRHDSGEVVNSLPSESMEAKNKSGCEFDITREVSGVFARASNLIREAVNADGVVFVDVNSAAKSQIQGRFANSEGAQLESSTESELDDHIFEESDRNDDEVPISDHSTCSMLGYSTKIKSSVRGFSPSRKHTMLSRRFINRLVRRFPQGHVFSFQNDGTSWSSSGGEGASEDTASSAQSSTGLPPDGKPKSKRERTSAKLAEIFPQVRTVAFLPLWDSRRERWRGAAFVWSSIKNRFLEREEDLTYLAAFSQSMLSELSRLDAVAADQAKATFIASVSHELRSPLHGVLAGAEFLQGTQLTPYQQEMARTITVAGNTLLDTINHILDFTKINSFTDVQRHQRVENDKGRNSAFKTADMGEVGVTSSVDLAVLTENVSDTVVKAHQFSFLSKQSMGGKKPTANTGPITTQDQVHVYLDIEKRPSWTVNVSPGSWTRLITNLLGNALKYTRSGSVFVRLIAKDFEKSDTSSIRLIIEDTGQGISTEYLQHHLYTPFMQENSHAVGTGLGLSIVRQIVSDIGGHIDIQSEVGRGTRIVVRLRSTFCQPHSQEPATVATIGRENECDVNLGFVGSQLNLEDETEESIAIDRQERQTRSCVGQILSHWLKYECHTLPSPHEASPGEICIITESDYNRLILQREEEGGSAGRRDSTVTSARSTLPAMIVLTTMPPFAGYGQSAYAPGSVIFVAQPFGPRKLSRAVKAILTERRRQSDQTAIPQLPNHRDIADFNQHSTSSLMSSRNNSVTGLANNADDDDTRTDKVLLVEDNSVNMNLLKAITKKLNRTYKTAENGLEAVHAYGQSPSSFNLILMDMSMPIMDGFAATEAIRAIEDQGKWKRCRIIAITGLGSDEARNMAYQSGVDGFMTKPTSLKNLKAIMEGADNI